MNGTWYTSDVNPDEQWLKQVLRRSQTAASNFVIFGHIFLNLQSNTIAVDCRLWNSPALKRLSHLVVPETFTMSPFSSSSGKSVKKQNTTQGRLSGTLVKEAPSQPTDYKFLLHRRNWAHFDWSTYTRKRRDAEEFEWWKGRIVFHSNWKLEGNLY